MYNNQPDNNVIDYRRDIYLFVHYGFYQADFPKIPDAISDGKENLGCIDDGERLLAPHF
jgi:hypothetical protein